MWHVADRKSDALKRKLANKNVLLQKKLLVWRPPSLAAAKDGQSHDMNMNL